MLKYHIITFGCQMNKSDSERIATVLEKIGYKPTSNIRDSNLIVVNMCSVRQSAVDRVHGQVKKIQELKTKNPNLKSILTGCILKEDKRKFAEKFDLILNIKELLKWPQKINAGVSCTRDRLYSKHWSDYLKIKPKRQNNFSAFIPISNGCNFSCSYCVIPQTRGRLICRDHQEILKEAEKAVKDGFKEIWLLGQNVNDYHSPIRANKRIVNFAKLLKIIDNIPGDFQIRFTSPNPANFSDELIEVMANSEKVAKYLNLPVQSGDNEILKKMNRPYTVEQYKNLMKKIREKIPDINLSTDVIVGFPGETKKQFENTVKLFKKIKFNIAYIAKYSPRPGTVAFQMKDDVPWEEKKKREKILRELIKK